MKHCLSVAGIPLPPLVKKVLMIERERNIMFGHLPIWKVFIVIRILGFISYWSMLQLEKNSLKNFFYSCGKFVLMSRTEIFKFTWKFRSKIWTTILFHIFINFVFVPK